MASDKNPHRLDFVRDAWRLAKPYFVSDDKKWAWGLLAAVVARRHSLIKRFTDCGAANGLEFADEFLRLLNV